MAKDNLRIITGIHFSKSMLKALNGITFLMNPNWDVEASDVATLPVAFFGIKGIHEIMESEVSQRPLLFYNDTKSSNEAVTNSSKLSVVADNILIKPKQYRMDIIIPYSNLTLLNGNSFVLSATQFSGVVSMLTGSKDVVSKAEQYIAENVALTEDMAFLSAVVPYMDVIKSVINTVSLADTRTVSSTIKSIFETPDYNKNSIEAMWRSRSVLKLKLWNGWRYKYVAITNFDVTKEGSEDGVYEASLTVQEMPIITLRNKEQTNNLKPTTKSNFKIHTAGDKMIGVLTNKEATEGSK